MQNENIKSEIIDENFLFATGGLTPTEQVLESSLTPVAFLFSERD